MIWENVTILVVFFPTDQKCLAADQIACQTNEIYWLIVAMIVLSIWIIATIEMCCVKRRLNKMRIKWMHVSW